MVGAVSLYNLQGERLHSIYIGNSPEYGKNTFKQRLEQEVLNIKTKYTNATYLDMADGATDNWTFIKFFSCD